MEAMASLQWLKCQVYDMVAMFTRLFTKSTENKKTLLIVRVNNIGDYMLWRNMLQYIRNSERFRDYHITLLGNISWKNLFEEADKQLVDDAIWVSTKQFKMDMAYRYRMLKTVREKGYEIVINTQRSRCKREDDAFVMICKNSYNIGQNSELTNVFSYEIGYDKDLYNELFVDKELFEFEFDRNKSFTEFILKQSLDKAIAHLEPNVPLPAELEGKDYFVIFPGSSKPSKIWKTENFVHVMQFVTSKYGLTPVICGSPSDSSYINDLMEQVNDGVINMGGKTNLLTFAKVLKEAHFMVSIDTGSVHLAAVSGGTVFGVFNGSHYKRYHPYPAYINPAVYGIYPDEIVEDLNKNPLPEKYSTYVDIDYNVITAEKVCQSIADNFKKDN